MLKIILGEIGSGKTARLLASCSEQPLGCADGFASIKTCIEGDFAGYRLRRLAGDEEIELAVKGRYYKGQFELPLCYDQFVFNNEAFRFGERVVINALADDSIRAIYIDEIGPIELQREGFHKLLSYLIAEKAFVKKDIYICVRTSCLRQVLKEFGITSYLLLT